MKIQKRDGTLVEYQEEKIITAIGKALKASGESFPMAAIKGFVKSIPIAYDFMLEEKDLVSVEDIQDIVEKWLMKQGLHGTARKYILYREQHKSVRSWVDSKLAFIDKYRQSDNTANATIDDNSNVSSKNIGIMNVESHKEDNILVSRGMIERKLKKLYPDFDSKQYSRDLSSHIIYKHDESTFSGAIAPYCVSVTMYPFLTDGISKLGGLSASPKNLDSFCGIFANMVHAIAGQFAGAVATSEFLLYFTYFAKKEWGNDFYLRPDTPITQNTNRPLTIEKQIEQHFQQIVYTINQPIGTKGLQSVFWNVSYFDKAFFEGMFGDFYFPDGSQPDWDSLNWTQRKFMQWFNTERLKCLLTFPVNKTAA